MGCNPLHCLKNMNFRGLLLLLVVFETPFTVVNGSSSGQRLLGLVKKLEAIVVRMNNQADKKLGMAPDAVKTVPSQSELDTGKENCSNIECPVMKISEAERDRLKRLFVFGSSLEKPSTLCGMNISITKIQFSVDKLREIYVFENKTTMAINTDSLWNCTIEATRKDKRKIKGDALVLWTSGLYAPSCNKYVWCPEKEVIPQDSKWKKGFPKEGAGNCVALQIGSKNSDDNGFFNSKCDNKEYGVCVAKLQ